MERRDTKAPWLVAAILAALVLDVGIFNGLLGTTAVGTDFKVFWDAAQRPLDALYPGEPMQPFVNPPTALLLFAPLAWLPTVPSYLLWTALNVLLFYAGMRRFFSPGQLLVAMISPLFVWCLFLGQSTPLLTGLLAFGVSLPPLGGGALLAFVLLMKPQIAWLLPIALFLRPDRERLASVLGFAGTGLSTSLLVLGWAPWQDWAASMPAFRSALLNQPIVLERSVALSAQALALDPMLAVFAWLLAVAFALYVLTRVARDAAPASILSLAIATSALAAPYALPHDIVALLPLAATRILDLSAFRRACACFFFLGVFPAVFVILFLVDTTRPRTARIRPQRSCPSPHTP